MTTRKPVNSFRIGSVQSAIWSHPAPDGRLRFGATIERRYQDKNGDWKPNSSFNLQELLALAKIVDITSSRMLELIESDREPKRTASSEAA